MTEVVSNCLYNPILIEILTSDKVEYKSKILEYVNTSLNENDKLFMFSKIKEMEKKIEEKEELIEKEKEMEKIKELDDKLSINIKNIIKIK